MWNEIAAWQETLKKRPDISAKTIALYTQDARRFATWLQQGNPSLKATEVTSTNAKTYRDHLLSKRYAPTTINRALISLMLFFDTIEGTNPFRNLAIICLSDRRIEGQRRGFPRHEIALPNEAYITRAASSTGNIAITAG